MTTYQSGDPTALESRDGGPDGSLTDHPHPPSLEQLEQRLNHTARLGPGERFNIHINPLVAAAAELLAQVVRLAELGDPGDIELLNKRLCDQVKRFEASARHHGIASEQMTAARYVLCTVLDETVLNTPWGGASDWPRISLLSRYHKETFGGEKFFQLVERLSVNPARHLHMLELMYLCLALGFEGKYRVITRGGGELDDIRDGLYRQIRQLRPDVPRGLSPQWRGQDRPQRDAMRLVPLWQLALFTAVCMVAMYGGFAWMLGERREAVLQPYQQLATAETDRRS